MEKHFQLVTVGATASDTGLYDCGMFATLEEAMAAGDNPKLELLDWKSDEVEFVPTGKVVARRDTGPKDPWVFMPEFEVLRLHLVVKVPGVAWDRPEHNCERDVVALRAKLEAEYPQVDWAAVYKAAAGFTIEAECHVCRAQATHIVVRYSLDGTIDGADFQCAQHAKETESLDVEEYYDEDEGYYPPDQVLPLTSANLAIWARFLYQRWLG